jgi:hypothetical protein
MSKGYSRVDTYIRQSSIKGVIDAFTNPFRLENDKLSPAFPWLSGLTRQLYDDVVETQYPYWFLVVGAAVRVDPSMIGLLNM